MTTESSGGSCTPDASRTLPPIGYQTEVHGCEVEALDMGCETYALSAVLDLGPAEASCDPSGGGPIGSVTETDPVTFCCSA